MKSRPSVSVIIPTYNRATVLPKAIESVLNQSCTDLELLVVDDGSTDNTSGAVHQIRLRDRRLRYLKLPQNRGIGFARNAGLRHARGRYIAWVDSDDRWLPGKLEAQLAVMDSHPEIEILFADFWNTNYLKDTRDRLFHQSRRQMNRMHVHHIRDNLYMVISGLENAILDESFVSLVTTVLRASVLEKVGGFDSTLSGPEDFEFFWRAALLGANFAYLDYPLVERHKDSTSITANRVHAWSETLTALSRCQLWCEKTNREELMSSIASAKGRAWRNLISAHGRNGDRLQALKVYGHSLSDGLSVRNFIFALTAIFGERALFILKDTLSLRQQSLQDKNDRD